MISEKLQKELMMVGPHELRRVAIMGGTFDPIHYGHLVTAEGARACYDLDLVVFVPSGRPPHKKEYEVTAAEDRYLMSILAVASNYHFQVSRIEIDRPGYSYAIDTVTAFRQLLGDKVEIFFITGADAILEILTWKNVDRLAGMCRFIAATRPGFDLAKSDKRLNRIAKLRERLHFLEVPALAISSTDIRRRVAEGRPIKYLLPESVEHYIYKKGLYVPK